MDDTRKPVIVAVVAAVVVVVLFALGVSFGGAGPSASADWRDRLSGFGAGGDLDRGDVLLGDGCEPSGEQGIAFAAACTLAVADRGGGVRLGSPVRRAELENVGAALRLTLVLQDTPISRTMDPGESTELTIGPEGGTVALRCLGLTGCSVLLS